MHEQAPQNKPKFEFKGDNWDMPSDIDLVAPATEEVIGRLAAVGFDPDTSEEGYKAQLGFNEALVNAIAHGNFDIIKPDESPKHITVLAKEEQMRHPEKMNKKVKIALSITKDRIEFRIKDEGKGFDPQSVPDPLAPENLLKSKGRGLFFMKDFFNVSHKTYEDGHEVTMVWERKAA